MRLVYQERSYLVAIPLAKNRALHCNGMGVTEILDWSWRSPCLITPFARFDTTGFLLMRIHGVVLGVSGRSYCLEIPSAKNCALRRT
jgi:hypothetical protein